MSKFLFIIALVAVLAGFLFLWFYVRDNDATGLYVALGCIVPVSGYLIASGLVDRRRARRWRPHMLAKPGLGILLCATILASFFYVTLYYTVGCTSRVGPGGALEKCDLGGEDLSGRDLQGADLSDAKLRHTNLQRANLRDTNLIGADLTGADLTGATLSGALLEDVDLQDTTGLTEDALARLLGVNTGELVRALSQRKIRLEDRGAILSALKDACLGKGVAGTSRYTRDESFHPLVLLNTEGETHAMTDVVLLRGLEPMALEYAELVVCVGEEQEVELAPCVYGTGGGRSIKRYQYPVHARLVAASSGATVAERDIVPLAPSCPNMVLSNERGPFTSHVHFPNLSPWLEPFVNANDTAPEPESPQPAATPKPTRTQPSVTLQPTDTSVNTQPSSSCPPSAAYVQDVTIPDGTEIKAGESFIKTWRMRSNGCAPWPPGTRLVFDSGTRMGPAGGVEVLETPPGDTADISVTMQAPTSPGRYTSYWRLRAPDGTRFGDPVYVIIVVP